MNAGSSPGLAGPRDRARRSLPSPVNCPVSSQKARSSGTRPTAGDDHDTRHAAGAGWPPPPARASDGTRGRRRPFRCRGRRKRRGRAPGRRRAPGARLSPERAARCLRPGAAASPVPARRRREDAGAPGKTRVSSGLSRCLAVLVVTVARRVHRLARGLGGRRRGRCRRRLSRCSPRAVARLLLPARLAGLLATRKRTTDVCHARRLRRRPARRGAGTAALGPGRRRPVSCRRAAAWFAVSGRGGAVAVSLRAGRRQVS